jgi:NADP-dependent 3-hydroxy acid dehydrogenase YdfG
MGVNWHWLAPRKVLTEAGHRVWRVCNDADGARLQRELGNFTPLKFDVTNEQAVRAAAKTVRDALGGRELMGLGHNAGILSFRWSICRSTSFANSWK